MQWGLCRVPDPAPHTQTSRCLSLGAAPTVLAGGKASGSAPRAVERWTLQQQPLASPPGAVPATGFLKQSGINIDSKGFIVVNKVSPGAAPVGGRGGGAGSALLMDELPCSFKLLLQGLFVAFYLQRLPELEFLSSLGWPVQGQELNSMTLVVVCHLRMFCEMLRFWEHHQEFPGLPPLQVGECKPQTWMLWVWL